MNIPCRKMLFFLYLGKILATTDENIFSTEIKPFDELFILYRDIEETIERYWNYFDHEISKMSEICEHVCECGQSAQILKELCCEWNVVLELKQETFYDEIDIISNTMKKRIDYFSLKYHFLLENIMEKITELHFLFEEILYDLNVEYITRICRFYMEIDQHNEEECYKLYLTIRDTIYLYKKILSCDSFWRSKLINCVMRIENKLIERYFPVFTEYGGFDKPIIELLNKIEMTQFFGDNMESQDFLRNYFDRLNIVSLTSLKNLERISKKTSSDWFNTRCDTQQSLNSALSLQDIEEEFDKLCLDNEISGQSIECDEQCINEKTDEASLLYEFIQYEHELEKQKSCLNFINKDILLLQRKRLVKNLKQFLEIIFPMKKEQINIEEMVMRFLRFNNINDITKTNLWDPSAPELKVRSIFQNFNFNCPESNKSFFSILMQIDVFCSNYNNLVSNICRELVMDNGCKNTIESVANNICLHIANYFKKNIEISYRYRIVNYIHIDALLKNIKIFMKNKQGLIDGYNSSILNLCHKNLDNYEQILNGTIEEICADIKDFLKHSESTDFDTILLHIKKFEIKVKKSCDDILFLLLIYRFNDLMPDLSAFEENYGVYIDLYSQMRVKLHDMLENISSQSKQFRNSIKQNMDAYENSQNKISLNLVQLYKVYLDFCFSVDRIESESIRQDTGDMLIVDKSEIREIVVSENEFDMVNNSTQKVYFTKEEENIDTNNSLDLKAEFSNPMQGKSTLYHDENRISYRSDSKIFSNDQESTLEVDEIFVIMKNAHKKDTESNTSCKINKDSMFKKEVNKIGFPQRNKEIQDTIKESSIDHQKNKSEHKKTNEFTTQMDSSTIENKKDITKSKKTTQIDQQLVEFLETVDKNFSTSDIENPVNAIDSICVSTNCKTGGIILSTDTHTSELLETNTSDPKESADFLQVVQNIEIGTYKYPNAVDRCQMLILEHQKRQKIGSEKLVKVNENIEDQYGKGAANYKNPEYGFSDKKENFEISPNVFCSNTQEKILKSNKSIEIIKIDGIPKTNVYLQEEMCDPNNADFDVHNLSMTSNVLSNIQHPNPHVYNHHDTIDYLHKEQLFIGAHTEKSTLQPEESTVVKNLENVKCALLCNTEAVSGIEISHADETKETNYWKLMPHQKTNPDVIIFKEIDTDENNSEIPGSETNGNFLIIRDSNMMENAIQLAHAINATDIFINEECSITSNPIEPDDCSENNSVHDVENATVIKNGSILDKYDETSDDFLQENIEGTNNELLNRSKTRHGSNNTNCLSVSLYCEEEYIDSVEAYKSSKTLNDGLVSPHIENIENMQNFETIERLMLKGNDVCLEDLIEDSEEINSDPNRSNYQLGYKIIYFCAITLTAIGLFTVIKLLKKKHDFS